MDRIVPRRDRRDDAFRLADHDGVADALFERELAARQEVGVKPDRRSRESDHVLRGHCGRRAELLDDHVAKLRRARIHLVGDRTQASPSLFGRSELPVDERTARGAYRGIDIVLVGLRNAAADLFRCRIDDVEVAGAMRLDPLSADEDVPERVHVGVSAA